MINIDKQIPEVYYEHSRDFQFIGRLYELILNYVKTNSDIIKTLPIDYTADSKLIDLLTTTLGFKSKHQYNVKQLQSVCSVLNTIIRNKGSAAAIQLAIDAVLHAEGIAEEAEIVITQEEVNMYIPYQLSDLTLIRDLMDYILPAGMYYNIYRTTNETVPTATQFSVDSSFVGYNGDNESTKGKVLEVNTEYAISRVRNNSIGNYIGTWDAINGRTSANMTSLAAEDYLIVTSAYVDCAEWNSVDAYAEGDTCKKITITKTAYGTTKSITYFKATDAISAGTAWEDGSWVQVNKSPNKSGTTLLFESGDVEMRINYIYYYNGTKWELQPAPSTQATKGIITNARVMKYSPTPETQGDN